MNGKSRLCINKKVLFITSVAIAIIGFIFTVNSISNQRVSQNTRAQFDSLNECVQKHGAGSVCMYGFGIASFPGYLKGDKCTKGYCYYKDSNYVVPLTECEEKYGKKLAFCAYGFGVASFPGYLKGDKCKGGYCHYKDPNYVVPLTECEEKYGKGLAQCQIGFGTLSYPGYLKGDKCKNGYCYYKEQ